MTQACALGLEPGTPLQLSYLVPFGREAQFIPGVRGLIRLAIQSGEVQWIQSRIVRAGEDFEVHYGTEQKIVHRPSASAGDDEVIKPEDMIGVYAVAEMKNGARLFEFMSKADVLAIRSRSQSANNGPWVTDFGEMARKTVIRRLCKVLPLSEEKLARALDHQARAESGEGPDLTDVIDVMGESVDAETGEMVPNTAPASRTEALDAELAKKQGGAA
jgi:recombination protein RecT